MKALYTDVGPSLPKVPVSELVGHEGPIQVVHFTRKFLHQTMRKARGAQTFLNFRMMNI